MTTTAVIRIAFAVGLGVGALGTAVAYRIVDAHAEQRVTGDPQADAGDLQRAREEFQDTMAESLAAMNRP
ncbi:MAG TPA: hypothetical protein VH539_07045 [Gemmatimonadaceae bacterium]